MKLKKAMMSLAAATAAGLCISAYADNPEKGQSGKLNLADPVTNATAAASGSVLTTFGGNWINTPPTAEDSYIVIDCEEGVTNEFTTTTTTQPVVQCDFELQVAPVPENLRPESAPGAQTAFCVCVVGNATNFWAYVSSGWEKLEGFTVPAAETDYSLRVTFDYKNTTKYVKFSVKTEGSTYTDLHEYGDSTTIWFETAQAQAGVSQYCFVGSGKVKSFAMAQCAVEAEVVVDPSGKEIAVPEAQVAAVAALATGSETVAQVLAATATTKFPGLTVEGVTVADAIALGLIAPDNKGEMEVKQTSVKVSGNALAASSDIAINVNVAKPEGSNATITYTLRGSTDGSTFEDVAGCTGLSEVPTIPTSLIGTGTGKYLFFKVKVSVEYPTAN